MAASLRALRRRIRSTQSTKKIFSAQELIAGARIVKAQARVEASKPYAREITRVLSALASSSSLDHPLLIERENPQRAGVLVITSDRGFAGSYNVNVLRRTEELLSLLRQEGKEPVLYVVGRKGETYYSFRAPRDGRDLHRLLRAAQATPTRRRSAACSSTPSPPVRTTRTAAPAPTASSAWTSCTSSTPSSARCSPRSRSPSGWLRWRSRRSRSSTTSGRTAEHGAGRERLRAPGVLRVRALGRGPARRAAAEVHHHPDLRVAARGGGVGVGVAPPGDEVGLGQRRGAGEEPLPAGQPGPPGGDHAGDQRDRRRVRRAGLERRRRRLTCTTRRRETTQARGQESTTDDRHRGPSDQPADAGRGPRRAGHRAGRGRRVPARRHPGPFQRPEGRRHARRPQQDADPRGRPAPRRERRADHLDGPHRRPRPRRPGHRHRIGDQRAGRRRRHGARLERPRRVPGRARLRRRTPSAGRSTGTRRASTSSRAAPRCWRPASRSSTC